MPTPRQVIAANTRRVLANLATTGLEVSTNEGGAWTAFVGNAVVHIEPASGADFISDDMAEGTESAGVLKVSDDATTQLVERNWIRETGVTPARVWELSGQPTLHSGKAVWRLVAVLWSPGQSGGPDRGATR